MMEMTKHGEIGLAALKAGMDRKTGRKYVAAGRLPSELGKARDWRTRPDPFVTAWAEVEVRLRDTPGLEAKTLFEMLREQDPARFQDGQLRTLQRRVRRWRAAQGPEQEIMLAQRHRPGEAAQTDFTRTAELAVTIGGQVFMHLLCVLVLPYSNWQWATVCLSESMAALRAGVQGALFQLGRVPQYHQTDNSTAATHRIPDGQVGHVEGVKRSFNADYVRLMAHLGMTPRTTAVGAKEQNGDVEASNGALKRRLEQALLLRGHRDFESVATWQAFVDQVARKANAGRGTRVGEDLAAMRELAVAKLPEYVEEDVRVSDWSTVRIKHCAYSVPSRLMGEWTRVRIFDDRIEIYFADELQLMCERLRGRNLKRIDYRHVIWSLIRKPGAFARYVFREVLMAA
ncbi:MAG: IS21 family transposase [Proteobacteria bacterium]|nr:IS21 family transposase [Pseudomonadota bacterium]